MCSCTAHSKGVVYALIGVSLNEPHINGTNVHEIYVYIYLYMCVCVIRPSLTICSNLLQTLQYSPCALHVHTHVCTARTYTAISPVLIVCSYIACSNSSLHRNMSSIRDQDSSFSAATGSVVDERERRLSKKTRERERERARRRSETAEL